MVLPDFPQSPAYRCAHSLVLLLEVIGKPLDGLGGNGGEHARVVERKDVVVLRPAGNEPALGLWIF